VLPRANLQMGHGAAAVHDLSPNTAVPDRKARSGILFGTTYSMYSGPIIQKCYIVTCQCHVTEQSKMVVERKEEMKSEHCWLYVSSIHL
jgi:hypothetical protein